jgi:hypothetical protein
MPSSYSAVLDAGGARLREPIESRGCTTCNFGRIGCVGKSEEVEGFPRRGMTGHEAVRLAELRQENGLGRPFAD